MSMQTDVETLPLDRPAAGGRTGVAPEIGKASFTPPAITITETALTKIVEAKGKLGLPVKGLRVWGKARSPLRADFALRFVPADEADSAADIIRSFAGIDLYIASDIAPYLDGATVDYVFSLLSSDFKVEAPMRKLDTPEGRLATQIQQLLDDDIIPALATHGGGAVLIDYKDGVVLLELTGGCQGCSMAGATMKDGIETSIKASFPDVQEVRDVTRHADGLNPYAR